MVYGTGAAVSGAGMFWGFDSVLFFHYLYQLVFVCKNSKMEAGEWIE